MQSAPPTTFDEAYYQRFYFDKKTSVVDPAHVERLSAFVAATCSTCACRCGACWTWAAASACGVN